ncbi:MAG: hypothetical protein M3Q99_04250 [Acidobacteriota bacterium]|nr:hypothetical protein [Acidobacteriota bacterium]
MKDFVFLIHAGATLFLVGLIWTIQIVHYPLFEMVGADGYADYQTSHMSRITYVVAPVMFVELVAAIYFVFASYEPVNPKFFWFGLALVLIIWASTIFVQSPIHGRLAERFDAGLVNKLVVTNWIRTIVWTMRGALVLWMVWLKLK